MLEESHQGELALTLEQRRFALQHHALPVAAVGDQGLVVFVRRRAQEIEELFVDRSGQLIAVARPPAAHASGSSTEHR